MGRVYHRDRLGRFAPKGFSGQTGGRGARLKSPGKQRAGGGAKMQAAKPARTIAKPKGLKPKAVKASPLATRKPRGAAKPKSDVPKRRVDVQIQRAKSGGQYGPDGHWYPAGAWMSQGKFVGAKASQGAGAAPRSVSQKDNSGRDSSTRVIRNRAPKPRRLAPNGQGMAPQSKMNKTAQKLNSEFFGSSGYLNANMDRAFRDAGSRGRAPIDNTRYLGALASRVPSKELRARTAAAVKQLRGKQRRNYIQDVQDARRNLEMTKFGVPRVGVSDRQLLDALRFDAAARTLAGQRAARRRKNARNSSEEYAWVTNAMLSTSRRRK